MTEHKICKGCKWNNYPLCNGIKMDDGSLMNIENLKPLFECVIKFQDIGIGFVQNKSELELKIEELEKRIEELES